MSAMSDFDTYRCQTRLGHWAEVRLRRWQRADFQYLGTITIANGYDKPHTFAWAWDEDGRSIDKEDRGFDLVDFKPALGVPDTEYFHWLGKEAA